MKKLHKPGQKVDGGGRLIGYRWGGARLAWTLGLSEAKIRDIGDPIRDVLLRVAIDAGSPLALEHGAALATSDRDFRRFDEVRLIDPTS